MASSVVVRHQPQHRPWNSFAPARLDQLRDAVVEYHATASPECCPNFVELFPMVCADMGLPYTPDSAKLIWDDLGATDFLWKKGTKLTMSRFMSQCHSCQDAAGPLAARPMPLCQDAVGPRLGAHHREPGPQPRDRVGPGRVRVVIRVDRACLPGDIYGLGHGQHPLGHEVLQPEATRICFAGEELAIVPRRGGTLSDKTSWSTVSRKAALVSKPC